MKVALIHDFLTQYGGAERVLEAICEIYPDAPIYTLVYDPEKMGNSFRDKKIKTSFIQKTAFGVKKYRWYLPWMPTAIESFDLNDYDLVISDSSAYANGVITLPKTPHICYCHTPTRYLWCSTHEYIETAKIPWPVNKLVPYALNYLRNWDFNAAQRPDYYIANSNYIKKRIKKYYRQDSRVIYPFVEDQRFQYSQTKKDFYFMSGRLVPYKRFDIAIEAFNKMPEKKLLIAGDGVEYDKLKKIIKSNNIKLLGRVDENKLIKLYQDAKGYIFTPEEDFGITPLEAMISGTPVIAFGKGGALETVIDKKTGIYFYNQTSNDIISVVKQFEKMKFDSKYIHHHAKKFSKNVFKENIKKYINKCIDEYKSF